MLYIYLYIHTLLYITYISHIFPNFPDEIAIQWSIRASFMDPHGTFHFEAKPCDLPEPVKAEAMKSCPSGSAQITDLEKIVFLWH